MKSSALIVLFGVFTATAVQAVEPLGYKPLRPGPVSHFRGSCESDPDGAKFAAKACILDDAFDPEKIGFYNEYTRPSCDRAKSLSDAQIERLRSAYTLAPGYMKAKLCRLTQLFITQKPGDTWTSWGFWEGADRPPGTGVFVAISSDALSTGKSIADEENYILNGLIHAMPDSDRAALPQFVSADRSLELGIVAELAHELGHALLADANADGTNRRHPRRRVSPAPRSACFESAVLGQSWNADIFHRHMTRWVPFASQNSNRQQHINFVLERTQRAVEQNDYAAATNQIRSIYRSGEFVSLFAATRPEEDLVETYKYKVLSDLKRPLRVQFPTRNGEIDTLHAIGRPVVRRKVNCLGQLGFLSQR